MKVLIVTCTVPEAPAASSEIIRNLALALHRAGVAIEILTTKNLSSDPNISYWEQIPVHHAPYVMTPSSEKSLFGVITAAWRKIKRILFGRTVLFRRVLVKALFNAAVQCHAETFDFIVPVCSLYDAAEVALRFKKKTESKGEIVLYQIDPLTENATYKDIKRDKLMQYETFLYSICKAVFTTNEIYSQKKGSWDLDHVHPIEFPVLKMRENSILVKKKSREIRCVFAGHLYQNLRSPRYLLEMFSKFSNEDIHLYFIGTGERQMLQKFESGVLSERLSYLGSMSADDCDSWYQSADILVNIGNSVSNQVPSKIFQYMSHGKPILSTSKMIDCPTRQYLEMYPLSYEIIETDIIDEDDVSTVQRWIEDNWKKTVPYEEVVRRFEKHTPEYVARQFMQEFERLSLQ